jgi:ABC-2 type transport system permease protein
MSGLSAASRPRGIPDGARARANAAWRVLTIGGVISFRGLFNWLNPYIYVPTMLVSPIFQILLFAYIGRSAKVESDAFFLVGNAVQYASIPCLFAMSNTIAGERWTQTLGIVLSTPANRVALFVGRSLPVIANGWFVSMVSLGLGAVVLGVAIPVSAWPAAALAVAVASASCTGLGLLQAALALRVRSTAVLSNIVFGVLLVFTGANVALDSMPAWMAAVGRALPLTHAIEACRDVVAGAGLGQVAPLLAREALLGMVCGLLGLAALRYVEASSRRHATLELQ